MISNGSLSGVKVLDLSRMLPGPYCSMILADHGADVIAIEKKSFKNDGLYFESLYRNKKHLTLDLKTDQGLKIFIKMAEKADVIIEGFRPGVVHRLGIDYETIKKRNPLVIYCSISGYGQSGDRKNLPGHDVNYLSTAGVLGLIGEKNSAPAIPGVQIADIAGGSMNAVVGILLALYSRDRIGEGQHIDISMTDGILGMLTLPSHFAEVTGQLPLVGDSLLSHHFACYNTYETKDGRYVSLGAVENVFWRKLCDHIGRPDFSSLQYDEKHRDQIISYFRDFFLAKTYVEWIEELEPLEVCFSGVKNMAEVYADESFIERRMIIEYTDSNTQKKKSFGIPVQMSRTPGSIRSNPGKFGGDSVSILSGLGYSSGEIDGFVKTGIV